MSDQNAFHFVGRLVKNAECGAIGQNATPLVTFSIAVNRWNKTTNANDTSYFDFSYYGKSAANLCQYMIKGHQVSVKGFVKQDRWQKDGKNYSRIVFVAQEVQLLGNKDNSSQNNQQPQQQYYQQQQGQMLPQQQYQQQYYQQSQSQMLPQQQYYQQQSETMQFGEDIPF